VSGRIDSEELEHGLEAMKRETAIVIGGAEPESASVSAVIPADESVGAPREGAVDRRKTQRPATVATLEERVRTETSQFDFTTLVALGGSEYDVSPEERAAAISWPLRTVQPAGPDSLDEIVPDAFAPPVEPPFEPTLKLIVKSTPTPAERRRASVRTWAVGAGAFVLGAAVWGFVPRGAAPTPANLPANPPAKPALIHESARVTPDAATNRVSAPTPKSGTMNAPLTRAVTHPAPVVSRPSHAARPRTARVSRQKPAARRPQPGGAGSASGFSNHVNSVLSQLP
jgi:hypothetical protein